MQIASDSFIQANGAPSANWTAREGTFAITSNAVAASVVAAGDSRALMYWNANPFPPNQWAQMTLTAKPTANRGIGPAARISLAAITFYAFYVNNNAYWLFKDIATSITTFATGPWTPANGDVLRLEANGNILTGKINGVVIASAIDSSIASGPAGIQAFTAVTTDPFGNNWSAGSLDNGSLLLSGLGV